MNTYDFIASRATAACSLDTYSQSSREIPLHKHRFFEALGYYWTRLQAGSVFRGALFVWNTGGYILTAKPHHFLFNIINVGYFIPTHTNL